jgi:hypothetical protein
MDDDLYSNFATLTHDDSLGVWLMLDDAGNELARADSLEAALTKLAAAGGGEVTW